MPVGFSACIAEDHLIILDGVAMIMIVQNLSINRKDGWIRNPSPVG